MRSHSHLRVSTCPIDVAYSNAVRSPLLHCISRIYGASSCRISWNRDSLNSLDSGGADSSGLYSIKCLPGAELRNNLATTRHRTWAYNLPNSCSSHENSIKTQPWITLGNHATPCNVVQTTVVMFRPVLSTETRQPLGILRYLLAKPRSKRCGARPSPASSASDASRRSSCHSASSHRRSAAALGRSQSIQHGHVDNLEPGSTPGSNRISKWPNEMNGHDFNGFKTHATQDVLGCMDRSAATIWHSFVLAQCTRKSCWQWQVWVAIWFNAVKCWRRVIQNNPNGIP